MPRFEKLFYVVHIRSEQEDREPEEHEMLEVRWFDNLRDARAYFETLRPEVPIFSPKKFQEEFIQLFEFDLSDQDKQFALQDPRHNADTLADDLRLDPTAGELLDQKPRT